MILCCYKKVNLFIMMTTNPKWPEITQELFSGRTTFDQPDIITCIFKLKQKALLETHSKKEIFGKVAVYVYMVEFQKQGLPHMQG